jgi:hypothetical protein
MASNLHRHGDGPPHEHPDAAPGHTHDDDGSVVGATTTDRDEPATAPAVGAAAAGTTAAATAHTHTDADEHTHEDADHTHDDERRTEVAVGPGAGGMVSRVVLTLLGAAGLIIGAFLPWFRFEVGEIQAGTNLTGVNTSWTMFYSTDFPFPADIYQSAGGVMILLGILAILGLVFRTGWLSTLAGVLGIVGVALVVISLLRVTDIETGFSNIGIGLWITLAGAVLAVLGGFFGARPRVVTRTV